MMSEFRLFLTLDAVRRLGNSVPVPLADGWQDLEPVLQELHSRGLLSIDSDHYSISREGKKALLLFDDERRQVAGQFEAYKVVNVRGKEVDARIPVAAFAYKGKTDKPGMLLEVLAMHLYWDYYMESIKGWKYGFSWQGAVRDGLYDEDLKNVADPNAWLVLGEGPIDAARTATLLLDPAQNQKSLIQITRS